MQGESIFTSFRARFGMMRGKIIKNYAYRLHLSRKKPPRKLFFNLTDAVSLSRDESVRPYGSVRFRTSLDAMGRMMPFFIHGERRTVSS